MLRHASITIHDEPSLDELMAPLLKSIRCFFSYVLSTDSPTAILMTLTHPLNGCKWTGWLTVADIHSCIHFIRCRCSSDLLRVLTIDGQDWKKSMRRLSPMPYFAVMLLSTSPGNQYAISLLVCMRESISCLCLLLLNARKTDLPGKWFFLSVISSSFGFIVAFLCFSLHLHTLHTPRRTEVKWK